MDPTREKNILNLCLSPGDHVLHDLKVHECFSTSDHCFITCQIDIPDIDCIREEKITYFDFKATDWELMRANLAFMDWNDILSPHFSDPDCMWNVIRNIFIKLYEIYIPEVTVNKKRDAPWLNANIKRMKRKRKQKWHVYRNNRTNRNLSVYKNYSKTVKNAINEAIKNYEHKKFSEKKYNARDFFKYIDNKTSQKQSISYRISNEIIITENEDKANIITFQPFPLEI